MFTLDSTNQGKIWENELGYYLFILYYGELSFCGRQLCHCLRQICKERIEVGPNEKTVHLHSFLYSIGKLTRISSSLHKLYICRYLFYIDIISFLLHPFPSVSRYIFCILSGFGIVSAFLFYSSMTAFHNAGYVQILLAAHEKINAELNKYHNYYLYIIEEGYRREEIDKKEILKIFKNLR